ncbi:hypothetical protein C499_00570 [Halogeometricum borinquense DSM 11551]|uniref:Uncharacterized protein n=1 Tax=Halogeometricum borinquense (strain ATCC 700274 / DSM 11551 / JCM 10706 / KCTC 4070 / PR3) TaxID=469382 RepID=E4NVX1_HALBP|nr:hypothetical protein [Halogeometricum borinquense]ADQ69191.1 hypothetical protein Hbor_38770 [Halogeometricum borinquense DSM 11551]ELY31606.1 hypothetical protein C499_00570 [Halogeometricum borinquense DSM 11551]
MDGDIIGENEDGIGVDVSDNNEIIHEISIEKGSWEIVYHEQDGYPDKAAKRTPDGNEHVNQARRFARYHVYKERGYETFPWDEHIGYIETVGDAIKSLSTEEFEDYFGEFYETVAGSLSLNSGGDITALFAAIQEKANAYYIDVYLDNDGQVEATSEVRQIIPTDDWQEELESPPEDTDRVPDARIELMPMPLPSIELFQPIVVHQTRCQIRDCYIVMGEEPPEEYRLLGFGKYKFASLYQRGDLSLYEDYTRLDADIPGYTVGLGLEEYPEIEGQVKSLLSAFADE